MTKSKVSSTSDAHAASFLGFAKQYEKAANLLPGSDRTLLAPIYFLYFHAIELALKAYLRAANVPIVRAGIRKHHRLTELFNECQARGLRIGSDDRFDFGNVAALLEGANEDQGLRYFSIKPRAAPELSWTRDAVQKLMRTVEPSVRERAKAAGIVPGRSVKFDFTIGRPEANAKRPVKRPTEA